MNDAVFDEESFLQSETTDALETDYTPIPEGEYQGVIDKIEANTTPTGRHVMNVTWKIDDQEVRDFTGMDEPTCRQSVWLDVDANGNLERGKNKNVGLGRLRDALGQNVPGEPWSPAYLQGQVALVEVKHSAPNDQGAIFANVVQVAPL